jgi:hypothetical protein
VNIPSLAEVIGPFHSAARATNTFTTKQDVSPAPVPVIPGGKLIAGTKMYIRAWGDYSALTGAVLTLGFWFGTRALVITGDIVLAPAFTCGTTPAAWPWWMDWEGQLNTNPGTAATWLGQGSQQMGSSLTAYNAETPIPVTAAARTTAAFDTTIERAIGVSATWGASSASNQITVNGLRVTIWN